MSITPRILNLSDEEKKKVSALLAEAESRGIDIPTRLKAISKILWPVDKNGYFRKLDGSHYKPTPAHLGFIESRAYFSAFIGARGSGKALDINTPIPTVDGWKKMADIVVGDTVFDSLGKPTKVVGVSNVMYGHKCYKVHFDDKSTIVADGEHLWQVLSSKGRGSFARRGKKRTTGRNSYKPQCQPKYGYEILTTDEMKDNLITCKRGDANYSIDLAAPLELPKKNLLIDPYVLGYWLGDGTSRSAQVTIGELDQNEVISLLRKAGHRIKANKTKYQFSIDTDKKVIHVNGQWASNKESFYYKLKTLNLIGNKHIPEEYLRASYSQRLSLLQGLMDSDGSISKDGRAEFTSISPFLADGFHELCMTLQIKVTKRIRYTKVNGEPYRIYRFSFVPYDKIFMLERKARRIHAKGKQSKRRYRRYIKKIEEIDSVPVKCITVASDNSLYLAGKGMIPTHNSAAAAQKALRKIKQGQSGLVYNPDFENLKISTWPEFREWIPWDMVVTRQRYRASPEWEPMQPFTLAFLNKAKVICKGVKNPGSARGPNVNWLWYDEGGRDVTGEAWQIAVASVRIGENPQAWVSTTPKGTQHWLYRLFVKEDIPDDAFELWENVGDGAPLVEMFSGTIEDNKANLSPGFYAAMLAAYPKGWLREQELYGRFVAQEGVLGDRHWFDHRIISKSEMAEKDIKARVRYWDLAASEKKITGKKRNDPDETVGTLMAWDGDDFYIEHQVSGHWRWKDIKETVTSVAFMDGAYVPVYVEQEPGSGGINQVEELKAYLLNQLPTHVLKGHRPKGDKVMRANIWFAEASQGHVYLVAGDWNESFLEQLDSFPELKHDDKIDSVSGARHTVAPIFTWKNIPFLAI